LYEIIDSEILKDEIIKTPKIKKRIEKGESIKKKLRNEIETTTNNFFSDVVKKSDATSIRMQKALHLVVTLQQSEARNRITYLHLVVTLQQSEARNRRCHRRIQI